MKYMETDKDHIHYMLETEPAISQQKRKSDEKSHHISYLGKASELS